MKKHILVISQYFYPESFRINDICIEWVKKGYKVTVVTGIPNYPEGKFYDGYNLFKKRKEKYNGIEIIRLPIFPRGKNSIMLALNFISFVISGFFWVLFTKINADYVFIFEVSPMTQALPGVWYSKKKKIKSYIYVQDLWPENVEIVGGVKNKIIIKSLEKMVKYIYNNCDKIFVSSKGFIEPVKKRGINENKIIYWPQYAEDFYSSKPCNINNKYINNKFFNITFTGNIGEAQGLDILPKAAKVIKEENKELYNNIKFNIIGNGRYKNELIRIVNELNVNDVFNFIPKQKPEKIPEFLACSDVAFLSLSDSPIFKLTIPAKVQTYMACGKPIIAAASGEIKNIINGSKSGECVDPEDYKKLSELILKISQYPKEKLIEMGNNAREYYLKNFNKKFLLDEMDQFFIN